MQILRRVFHVMFVAAILVLRGAQPQAAMADGAPQSNNDQGSHRGAHLVGTLRGCGGTCVEFSRDGTRLLTAGRDEARVWDAHTLQPVTPPLKHGATITTAEFSHDGKRVVTGGGPWARVWDARTGKPLTARIQHGTSATILARLSPDGTKLLTGGILYDGHEEHAETKDDRIVRLWDVATGKQILELKQIPLRSLSLSARPAAGF